MMVHSIRVVDKRMGGR